MSRRTSNSPPPRPLDSAAIARTQFPKWNRSAACVLSICAASGRQPHSHSPLAIRHCLSNRNTSKLEFAVTPTKQSPGPFLIATFRAPATIPVQYWFTLRNEGPAPNSSSEAQKLENLLTRLCSATYKFLIDNFVNVLPEFPRYSLTLRSLPLRNQGPSHRHSNRQSEASMKN